MTLLTICQTAIDEIGSFDRDVSIAGNSDVQARQLLALANRVGREIYKYSATSWQKLLNEHTFTTINGTATYALPSDYYQPANTTQWDLQDKELLEGPITPTRWAYINNSWLADSSIITRFRIRDDMFEILPTPTDARTISYHYWSKNWVQAVDATEKDAFTADTDTALIDEDLIILGVKSQFLAAKGLPYDIERSQFLRALDSARAADGGKSMIDLGRRVVVDNIPDGSWPQ